MSEKLNTDEIYKITHSFLAHLASYVPDKHQQLEMTMRIMVYMALYHNTRLLVFKDNMDILKEKYEIFLDDPDLKDLIADIKNSIENGYVTPKKEEKNSMSQQMKELLTEKFRLLKPWKNKK